MMVVGGPEQTEVALLSGGIPCPVLAKSLADVRVLWCAGGMYRLTLSARREITKRPGSACVIDHLEAGSARNSRRKSTKNQPKHVPSGSSPTRRHHPSTI